MASSAALRSEAAAAAPCPGPDRGNSSAAFTDPDPIVRPPGATGSIGTAGCAARLGASSVDPPPLMQPASVSTVSTHNAPRT